MPTKVIRNQGKGMFVKEALNLNPEANAAAINQAWKAAGMSGSISPTLISTVRSRLGLTSKKRRGRRRNAKSTGTGATPGTIASHAGSNGQSGLRSRERRSDLMGLEVEIDRVLMKVVALGSLPDVENALRKVRRQLYADMVARS